VCVYERGSFKRKQGTHSVHVSTRMTDFHFSLFLESKYIYICICTCKRRVYHLLQKSTKAAPLRQKRFGGNAGNMWRGEGRYKRNRGWGEWRLDTRDTSRAKFELSIADTNGTQTPPWNRSNARMKMGRGGMGAVAGGGGGVGQRLPDHHHSLVWSATVMLMHQRTECYGN
jgi:hypothetical protein